MKVDTFKVVSIVFLLGFFGMLIYFGIKEPPPQIIKEVEKTNPIVQKKIEQLVNKEVPKQEGQSLTASKTETTNTESLEKTSSAIPTSKGELEIVDEIVKKNKALEEVITNYKEFQMNYLRYNQATSGGKFPNKGEFFKTAYENAFEKLANIKDEEQFKTVIDFALNEWRKNVKTLFFTKLSEVQNEIKDKAILERIPKLTSEDSMLLMIKGLSSKLSLENRERLLSVYANLSDSYLSAKKELEKIINTQ